AVSARSGDSPARARIGRRSSGLAIARESVMRASHPVRSAAPPAPPQCPLVHWGSPLDGRPKGGARGGEPRSLMARPLAPLGPHTSGGNRGSSLFHLVCPPGPHASRGRRAHSALGSSRSVTRPAGGRPHSGRATPDHRRIGLVY